MLSVPSLLQYSLFLIIVIALVKPVGGYIARVFEGKPTFLDPLLRPLESVVYRVLRTSPKVEMDWRSYANAFLSLSLVGTLLLYALLRLQAWFPWHNNAYLTTPLTPDLAMNTAISFSTTTTWQAYGGETTMSYWSQIVGLTAQNFLAGAAGLCVGIAFIRGFARERAFVIGNFWVDLTRAVLWVLLPISLVGSLILVWQGTPSNFAPYTSAATLEGAKQVIPQGPVAALQFIENLGTNGGGFFNANGAHPYENPTPLTNFLEMLAIVVLPASLTYTFGCMTRRPRDGWLLFWVMFFLFTAGLAVCHLAEQSGVPATHLAEVPGGNLEGKETRFGIGASVLTAVTTSNGATGSVNAAPDSLTPLGVTVPLINMLLGEIIFGGLGTGIYSIILVALLGLFIVGLMVGRTPEYLGKVIGVREVKLIILYTLACPAVVLLLTALTVVSESGLAGLTTNGGAHGFTEVIFAYASCAANNGQAMAGLSANSAFFNNTTAIAMMVGRFALAIPALALSGLFAAQRRRPPHSGAVPTDTLLFGTVVIGAAILVSALCYLPALALGPLAEQFSMVR